MSAKYEVGQRLVLRDANEQRSGGPSIGTVVKVGRTLVHVQDERYPNHPPRAYRMQDGTANDRWGHAWVQTVAEADDEKRRNAALAVLRAVGVTMAYSRLPTAAVEAMAGIARQYAKEAD